MSYCRWSTDDFQCDVYVYADARGGWTTHVAGRRVVYKEPLPPVVPFPGEGESADAWFERYRKVNAMHDEADLVDIGLPYDGDCFSDDTPSECADRLAMLHDLGYIVPQDAIDALRQEQDELGLGSAEGKERSDP